MDAGAKEFAGKAGVRIHMNTLQGRYGCFYCTVTLMVVEWEMAPDCAVTRIDAVRRLACPFMEYPPQEASVSARVITASELAATLGNAA